MKELYEKIAVAPLAVAAGVGVRAAAGAIGRAVAGRVGTAVASGAARNAAAGAGRALNHASNAMGVAQSVRDLAPKPAPPPSANSANVQASSLSPKMAGIIGKALKSPGLGKAFSVAGRGVETANTVIGVGQLAKELMPSPPPPPAPPTAGPPKVAHLEARLAKLAFGVSNGVNIASYLSMIGAEAVPHTSPWHARLEAAGLLGLAGSTVGNMITDPSERGPGQKDLMGLAMFGSALHDRMGRPHMHMTAGAAAGETPSEAPSEEKRGAFGPVLDVSLAGIPSAIGYAEGVRTPVNEREAREYVQGGFNVPGFMLMPGYTGYHLGRRAAAQKVLDRVAHGEELHTPQGPKVASDWSDYREGLNSTDPEAVLRTELADARLAHGPGHAFRVGYLGALGAGTGALTGALSVALSDPNHPHVDRRSLIGGLAGGLIGGVGGGLLGHLAHGYAPKSPYEGMDHDEAIERIKREIAQRGAA